MPHDSAWSLFRRFLKFGLLAWGGPAAQIAMISRECVDEEGWVDEETFQKTLAVYQVLPGPEAHELCVYFGRLRGGKRGGFAAGLGFMLPGFVLMLGLSVLYVEAGLDERFEELFYGLKAAVGALVAMAIVRLGRKFISDTALAVIAVAAFGLTLGLDVSFLLVLLGAGVAYELWTRAGTRSGARVVLADAAGRRRAGGGRGDPRADRRDLPRGPEGRAADVRRRLHPGAAAPGHRGRGPGLADRRRSSSTALALGGILPAPMIIFSTFVGYLAGGMVGGLAMTVGIFLPAFLFPIFFHRQLVALAENPHVRPFLLGVAAGVIGLIGAVTVEILRESVVDVPAGLLAVGAFLALYRFQGKLTVLFVVLGCGLLGAGLQLTVL